MKSGTTATSGWLRFAGIRAPYTLKEPNYFSDDANYSKGAGWYAQQVGAPEEGLVGDCSTQYLDPEQSAVAATRLERANPDVRIIVCVRDPLDRAISHVGHAIRLGHISGSSAEEVARHITTDSQFARRSCYTSAIEPWLERFDERQFLILFDESDVDARWRAVCSHLGSPDTPFPNRDERRYDRSGLRSYKPIVARWTGSRLRTAVSPLLPLALKKRVATSLSTSTTEMPPSSEVVPLIDPEVVELLRSEHREFMRLTAGCRST